MEMRDEDNWKVLLFIAIVFLILFAGAAVSSHSDSGWSGDGSQCIGSQAFC
jgi:hypothetical protein